MKLANPIQAVTFDVGGTLIDPWPSVGHIYAEVAAEHGITGVSPEELTRRFAAGWKARADFSYSKADWAGLVDETFAGLCELPPSRTFFDELFRRFDEPGAWRVHEDVFPALSRLRAAGLKLGVISNWDDRLPPLLDRLGLRGQFQAVAISFAVGCRKPSPKIFQSLLREMALDPGAVLHVGDSLEMDVQGARAAGLAALHLRRRAASVEGGEIKTLLEISERLQLWNH